METKLSTRLRAIRKSLSLTPKDVVKKLKAKDLNYSTQSIYKWEDGSSSPNINTLKILADIYNCNFSYLLDESHKTFIRLTTFENLVLNEYRTNFLFRSISTQIIKRFYR